MTVKRATWCAGIAVVALAGAGCTTTNWASQFNGLPDANGQSVVHARTKVRALHLFVGVPFLGHASLDDAVDELTEEARESGATGVRIVQSRESTYWWLLPPISFVLTPAVSEVSADLVRSGPVVGERGADTFRPVPDFRE